MAYLKTWTDNFFQIINNIKTRASREMTSRKNIQILDFNWMNVAKYWSDCLVKYVIYHVCITWGMLRSLCISNPNGELRSMPLGISGLSGTWYGWRRSRYHACWSWIAAFGSLMNSSHHVYSSYFIYFWHLFIFVLISSQLCFLEWSGGTCLGLPAGNICRPIASFLNISSTGSVADGVQSGSVDQFLYTTHTWLGLSLNILPVK